ncbi:hypothetical protein L7F22_008924 [Adiantum nelumboides]|nr:hypothetical protein [Adiantum nelumboides]
MPALFKGYDKRTPPLWKLMLESDEEGGVCDRSFWFHCVVGGETPARARVYSACFCPRPENVAKTAHLMALPRVKERLELVKADLLEEGSFDAAVAGCEAVFHTASPFFMGTDDPQKDLIEPALKGTQNVLNACGKSKSIKRVVLTSSIAAVLYTPARKPEDVVDERFLSDPTLCRQNKLWYQLSKTQAEMEAWNLAKAHGLDLVTINPALVVGHLLQPTLNTSSGAILKLLNGSTSAYANAAPGWVHVKDVAAAHILAYEVAEASGRYICAESIIHYKWIVEMLQTLYPNAPIPMKCLDESSPPAPEYQICTDKVKSLDWCIFPSRMD